MISLPEEYVVSKFFQYAYNPKHNRYNNTYQGGCPVCREGGSLGKKRRCYYIPKNNNIFCHNCGWSSVPFNWVKEVSGKTSIEIINEVKDFSDEDEAVDILEEVVERKVVQSSTLPKDSINLFDDSQLSYHKDNKIVQACLETIKSRRLDTAINRPDSLYVSLTDQVHKNRLIIPFINESNSIEFYQTRTVLSNDSRTRPKYISKINAEKTLFNINKISGDSKSVFIFEGPLNAFFTKNSVAVAGITERGNAMFTKRQQQQADTTLKWLDKVWVLDSQWLDDASLRKSKILLDNGQKVFIWPEKLGRKFKDFNDICMAGKIDEISADFIEKNTFEGLEGIFKLSYITNYRVIRI